MFVFSEIAQNFCVQKILFPQIKDDQRKRLCNNEKVQHEILNL